MSPATWPCFCARMHPSSASRFLALKADCLWISKSPSLSAIVQSHALQNPFPNSVFDFQTSIATIVQSHVLQLQDWWVGGLCVQSVLLKLQLRQLPWWLFIWLLLGPCRLRVCGLWSRCCHHMGMVMSFLVLAIAASSMVNTWMISSSLVGI